MSYKLVYKKPAVKEIGKLPIQIRRRLKVKLEWFAAQSNPLEFSKQLTKPADAQYRFRVGNYRVLFDMDGERIIILYIQHRKDIYRR
jgi:mRNA interferase RelE/StbE